MLASLEIRSLPKLIHNLFLRLHMAQSLNLLMSIMAMKSISRELPVLILVVEIGTHLPLMTVSQFVSTKLNNTRNVTTMAPLLSAQSSSVLAPN